MAAAKIILTDIDHRNMVRTLLPHCIGEGLGCDGLQHYSHLALLSRGVAELCM